MILTTKKKKTKEQRWRGRKWHSLSLETIQIPLKKAHCPLLFQGSRSVTSSALVLLGRCQHECATEDEAGCYRKKSPLPVQNTSDNNDPEINLHIITLSLLYTCFSRNTTDISKRNEILNKILQRNFKKITKRTISECINTLQITITIIETRATWY